MCGRYTYLFSWKQLQRLMRLLDVPEAELFPRYNVAPTQQAPVVRLDRSGERAGVMMTWGLVPSWATSPVAERRPCNARAESVFDKPTFRRAAQSSRCLVPVSGFYEWKKLDHAARKQPFWIGRADREPFCFAGLFERWVDSAIPGSGPLETFAILTTSPNQLMRPVHDRMPVIVSEDSWSKWLDPATPRSEVESMLEPREWNDFRLIPVRTTVNSVQRDDPTLIEPVALPENPPGLFG